MLKKIGIVILILIAAFAVLYFAFPQTLYKAVISLEMKRAGLTQKSLKAAGHDIVYLEGGQGENVLLVHGFAADKSNWVRFARTITPDYHVVVVDLPGFGDSTKLADADYGIKEQAARLDKIVNKLGLDKFHLAGNSMGGAISGRYAAEYPDKVLSLGLVNSGGLRCPVQSELRKMAAQGNNPLLVNTTEDYDKLMEFVFVKPPFVPRPIKRVFTEKAIKDRKYNDKVWKDLIAEQFSMQEDLDRIKARTLILWGDKDRLIDVSCVELFEKGLQNSKTIIMKNCGHAPMIERPDEAADYYLDFIRSK